MIWLVVSTILGTASHILIKMLNARGKENYSAKEFFRRNWISYVTSVIGSIATVATMPGLNLLGAYFIGYTGGSVAKNALKKIELTK